MVNPTVSEFKAHFFRDFPYGADQTKVMDADITKAISEASMNINGTLFGSQETYSLAFLYLTAHYLVTDLRAASQGVSGAYTWLESSKAVGSVSQGFSIPENILKNPVIAQFSKTHYGAKYISLVLPHLVGGVFYIQGATQA